MEKTKIRTAVVAGQFYPGSALALKRQIESFLDKSAQKQDVIACMLPHAGYIYSGAVAAQTVSRMNIKEKIILLGPNHTGYGENFSLMAEGIWQTPLGQVKIDSALAKEILKNSRFLKEDALAHAHEHSLEVELPFLQYVRENFEIVPIAFLSSDISSLKEIGREIAQTIKLLNLKDKVLIVASSDMTHYEPQEYAQKKDHEAIKAILALDEDLLAKRIQQLGISMCGYAPVIAMLKAAKELGATKSALVKYQTSGDITGDTDSVVGYAGIIVY